MSWFERFSHRSVEGDFAPKDPEEKYKEEYRELVKIAESESETEELSLGEVLTSEEAARLTGLDPEFFEDVVVYRTIEDSVLIGHIETGESVEIEPVGE